MKYGKVIDSNAMREARKLLKPWLATKLTDDTSVYDQARFAMSGSVDRSIM